MTWSLVFQKEIHLLYKVLCCSCLIYITFACEKNLNGGAIFTQVLKVEYNCKERGVV